MKKYVLSTLLLLGAHNVHCEYNPYQFWAGVTGTALSVGWGIASIYLLKQNKMDSGSFGLLGVIPAMGGTAFSLVAIGSCNA